jgi:hypothetical protein
MSNFKSLFLAVIATVAIVSPAMARDHHNHDRWRNNNYNNQYFNNAYCNPNPYPNGVQTWNGSWVDGTVGPDGYPAWAGGYRPR